MKPNPKSVWVSGPLIVGAGPSGIATAACLKEKGINSLILEKELCIASSWKLRTYERLHLHLPKHFCELPFKSFPQNFPTYPTKQQFIDYIEDYTDYFDLNPLFGTEVIKAVYDSSIGLWRVITSNGMEFICRWLVVASGENSEAVFPEFAGISEFKGRVLHTSEYKKGDDFAGEKVLVVGCGNSGMEVSLDLCNNNCKTSLVVRNKLHILPRDILGVSTFGLSMWLLRWLPAKLVDWLLLVCSWLVLGGTEKYGLSRPKMGPMELKNTMGKTPVLDVGTLSRIKSGHIKVVPAISRFREKGVEYVNGKQEEFDSVIFATGYRSNVPTWLKDVEFFNDQDGFPRKPFPWSWKGEKGIYTTGFARRGLLGASTDARRIADDIADHLHTRASTKSKKPNSTIQFAA